MKWIYFPTLPPYEKEVLFDGDDNENPPSWGRLRKIGNFDEIVVMESSGEENFEPLSDYKRWLDESPDSNNEASFDDLHTALWEAGIGAQGTEAAIEELTKKFIITKK